MNDNQASLIPAAPTAGVVADLLERAGIQLAIAELGTGGALAAALRRAAAPSITAAHVFSDAPALAAALGISEAKMAAFGAVSAMVAAEAAAALIDTYEGGWGLAVLARAGNHRSDPGVTNPALNDTGCFIALGTPSSTEVVTCAPAAIVPTALALLQSAAETRLATKRGF